MRDYPRRTERVCCVLLESGVHRESQPRAAGRGGQALKEEGPRAGSRRVKLLRSFCRRLRCKRETGSAHPARPRKLPRGPQQVGALLGLSSLPAPPPGGEGYLAQTLHRKPAVVRPSLEAENRRTQPVGSALFNLFAGRP